MGDQQKAWIRPKRLEGMLDESYGKWIEESKVNGWMRKGDRKKKLKSRSEIETENPRRRFYHCIRPLLKPCNDAGRIARVLSRVSPLRLAKIQRR